MPPSRRGPVVRAARRGAAGRAGGTGGQHDRNGDPPPGGGGRIARGHAVTGPESIRPPVVVASDRRAPGEIALGDSVTIEDGPGLHQHLNSREAGEGHPVGGAIHPGTTVALGLGIDAAIQAADGKRLRIGTLRYCSFTMERRVQVDRPLRATGRVVELGAHHVECTAEVRQDGELVCAARVGLCRTEDGRAAPLSAHYRLGAAGDGGG